MCSIRFYSKSVGARYDFRISDSSFLSQSPIVPDLTMSSLKDLSGNVSRARNVIFRFDPFPDEEKERAEYKRRIRENLERTNKIISDGVAKAKTTGSLGVRVIIRPVKKMIQRSSLSQKKLDIF